MMPFYREQNDTAEWRTMSYLYMCRLSGPSRLEEEGPDMLGSEVTAARLKGLEWSKTETAMDALVLAPENPSYW